MKNIKALFLAIIVFTLFSGCGDDDEFYNSKYITIPNLIQIESQANYAVGDVVWLHTNFSRYLNEPDQTTPLDIFRTTGGASFGFVFGLEKKNSEGTWTIIDLEDKMIQNQGNIFDGFFNIAECIYDPAESTYKFRAGIPLAETGQYRIFFGFTDVSRFELTSNNTDETSTYLNIKTTANTSPDGFFNFTVE